MASEWVVETPAGQVRLTDFTLDEAVELEESAGAEWWNICSHPFRRANVARATYVAACKHVGCEPKTLKLGDLVEGVVFVQVEDDLPDVYEEGIPKAEEDQEMSG